MILQNVSVSVQVFARSSNSFEIILEGKATELTGEQYQALISRCKTKVPFDVDLVFIDHEDADTDAEANAETAEQSQ